MKNTFTIILLLIISLTCKAQLEKTEVVTLTARLNSIIEFKMDNSTIVFEFNTQDEYQNGIGGTQSDYRSKGSVSSNTNWSLCFSANNELQETDGDQTLDLNNIGITANFIGSNKIATTTEENPIPLTRNKTSIIDQTKSLSNAGDHKDNAFEIYWEMGTQKGNLSQNSIMDQNLNHSAYATDVQFAVVEQL